MYYKEGKREAKKLQTSQLNVKLLLHFWNKLSKKVFISTLKITVISMSQCGFVKNKLCQSGFLL